jgi:mono/diheme cytochrome c family protein
MKTFASTAVIGALVAALFVARAPARSAQPGDQIYATNCASCHRSNGQGRAGDAPPLANNAHVTGSPRPVIETMLDGKTGVFWVDGKHYAGVMPSFRRQLSADQIAAVTTYIRASWGNHASAVAAWQVKSGRRNAPK